MASHTSPQSAACLKPGLAHRSLGGGGPSMPVGLSDQAFSEVGSSAQAKEGGLVGVNLKRAPSKMILG